MVLHGEALLSWVFSQQLNMIYGNQNAINAVPVATTYDASISASTEIVLNTATRLLQVTAITSPILLSWGADDASTSNFDAVISPNASLFFNVPYQSGSTLYTAVNFIEGASNGILVVCEY